MKEVEASFQRLAQVRSDCFVKIYVLYDVYNFVLIDDFSKQENERNWHRRSNMLKREWLVELMEVLVPLVVL